MRVRLFIDFWNLPIEWNKFHDRQGRTKKVKIPWDTTLVPTVCNAIDPVASYAGTHVYASVDPGSPKDAGLARFFNVMDGFPGFTVTVKERKQASRLHCVQCNQYIDACPHCKKPLRRTVEKGVDTSLVTDLITMSLDSLHDRAVIVSADADFVPAVEFLQRRGHKVTHLFFKPLGAALRNACWDHRSFDQLMPDLVS